MTRQRTVLHAFCLLALAAGCASGHGATSGAPTTLIADPGATSAQGTRSVAATQPRSADGPANSDSTAVPVPNSELGSPPPPQPVPAAQAAPTPAPATPPRTILTTVPATPTLPAWTPPPDALTLPAPDGPAAVGIAASGLPDTVVFYPAVAGTGHGHHRYIEPPWATAAGLDPSQMDRVVSAAQIDATPAPADAPRPVVILSPGWRSVVAFSTALAEDLASHGYVVLATQTDVAAEWSHPQSTPQDRSRRVAILSRTLDFLQGPSLPALVGPVDQHRIAVGGHSYAASIAFDASLTDRRIAAMFDLDGNARGEATRTSPIRPTLVLVTVNDGAVADPLLGTLAARSTDIVSVGVLNALHFDVTDAASIPSVLGTSVFSTLVGRVGSAGTTDTSTIMLRFLDATLGTTRRQPSSEELVRGMASATADPFGSQVPAG